MKLFELFKKRWYVGLRTLKVVPSRFFAPPLGMDWEGGIGPFDDEAQAMSFANEVRAEQRKDGGE